MVACDLLQGGDQAVATIDERSDSPGRGRVWIDAGPKSSSVHLAFQAKDRATVDRFYKEGLKAGGRDNGAPGERQYHPGYYAAFLFDPDGNNIEAVYHGPAERSAKSVEVTFGEQG